MIFMFMMTVCTLLTRKNILKFNSSVRWFIHIQMHMESYSANYIMYHEKVIADNEIAWLFKVLSFLGM